MADLIPVDGADVWMIPGPVTVAVVLIACMVLSLRRVSGVVPRAWRVLGRAGCRQGAGSIAVGSLAGLVAVTVSLARSPAPLIQDEFSYLLAADTFAQGRVTNPTHPYWHHFETFQVFHEPTYMSKYPPAQGALLAIGQRLGGDPLAGVWMGTALSVASVCWMLQGWVPGY